MKHNFLIVLFIASFLGIQAQEDVSADILSEELENHVSYLASDDLEGRYPGTEGDLLAANYIRDRFSEAGLELGGDNGFQYFELVTGLNLGEGNYLKVGRITGTPEFDFMPMSFSQSSSLSAPVVFVGYGFDITSDSLNWNDYANVNVAGKWVLVMRGMPDIAKYKEAFKMFASDRDKVLTARDQGAKGVLLVSGKRFDADDVLSPLTFDKTQSDAGLPVIHITRRVADNILLSICSGSGNCTSLEKLESDYVGIQMPLSMESELNISATVDLYHDLVKTQNIFGMLRGNDPLLQHQYVVVGAHYDHLGWGGSASGSRFLDSLAIHNGADDNASGVAGIIEMAERFGQLKSNKRSIIFVAFGAEEMGLLGSKYFVENSPVNTQDIAAMVNFDMIGRLDEEDGSILVGGVGTAVETVELLDSMAPEHFGTGYSPDGFGPSDHAAFYGVDIPVFFISSGAHLDYHTPADDAEFLNYQGQKEILDWSYTLVENLASRDKNLTFQSSGPKERPEGTRTRFKVTLGIMPDFTGDSNDGLRVDGVRPDGPAGKGGMLKGDIIVALDGLEVTNIYDYMNRLKKLEAGSTITVDVIRDEKLEVLIIQL